MLCRVYMKTIQWRHFGTILKSETIFWIVKLLGGMALVSVTYSLSNWRYCQLQFVTLLDHSYRSRWSKISHRCTRLFLARKCYSRRPDVPSGDWLGILLLYDMPKSSRIRKWMKLVTFRTEPGSKDVNYGDDRVLNQRRLLPRESEKRRVTLTLGVDDG